MRRWSIATATAESNWNLFAVSPAGAKCLFQIMPATAEHLGITDVFDVEQCIDGGVRYIAWCTQMWLKSQKPRPRTFDEAAKIGSYCFNAGPAGPVDGQKSNGCRYWDGCFELYAPHETRVYVPRVAMLAESGVWHPGSRL